MGKFLTERDGAVMLSPRQQDDIVWWVVRGSHAIGYSTKSPCSEPSIMQQSSTGDAAEDKVHRDIEELPRARRLEAVWRLLSPLHRSLLRVHDGRALAPGQKARPLAPHVEKALRGARAAYLEADRAVHAAEREAKEARRAAL